MILWLVLFGTDWSGCVFAGHGQVSLNRAGQHTPVTPTYTQLRFPRREGMRIDFVLGSPALAARVGGARIDREKRKGKGASDHAPVVVELAD